MKVDLLFVSAAPFLFTPFEILSHMAMREFHGRQIFIADNRKIMALYNVYASAEVDLARREKNHYNLVSSQPIYFVLARSKVTEPKQSCSQPEAWMFYCLFLFSYEWNKFVRVKSWKKLLNMSERNILRKVFSLHTDEVTTEACKYHEHPWFNIMMIWIMIPVSSWTLPDMFLLWYKQLLNGFNFNISFAKFRQWWKINRQTF